MAAVTDKTTRPASPTPEMHRYPWWCARFWHGMCFGDWFRLVAQNRFRVHPFRWPLASTITMATMGNSAMHALQSAIYGRSVRETEIHPPPIFIIGHWRSGTTYLHELLTQDDRLVSPTNYQCYAATHFLVSQWLIPRLFWFLLPSKRPMDNVMLGWDRPQEDEFALCSLGMPSPYLRMAFPNHGPVHMEYLDMEGIPEEELRRWKDALRQFVRMVTFHRRKRLLLKSPPHTGRIQVLAELFPGAKFVHMVRDPFVLFPSTVHLWRSLDHVQGLQVNNDEGLHEYVFQSMERMYRGFRKQRPLIEPSHICDVRYEDLVGDPVGQVRRVYESLELGDFERVRPSIEQFAASKKSYKTNVHRIDDRTRDEISRRWADYIERYGYSADGAAPEKVGDGSAKS